MTTRAGVGHTRARQIAVLGSSEDIATESEIVLAEQCGIELARRGITLVVGGSDGVMEAAARAVKAKGGVALAVLPREKELANSWLFDCVVDTGLTWVQFSDVILRSCCGALIVGGGAGTLGELSMLYLSEIPAAFVGVEGALAQTFSGRSLDPRDLSNFPAFDEPSPAIDYILERYAAKSALDAASLQREGADIHLQSYPFGSAHAYLKASERFREAAVLTSSVVDESAWTNIMAEWMDTIGDHFYYEVDDFLQAGTYYARALAHAKKARAGEQPQAFSAYLRAIMLESIAFGLHQVDEFKLAQIVVEAASKQYEDAISCSPPDEHKYLNHSSIGLQAAACYFEALHLFEARDFPKVREKLVEARKNYEMALHLQPLWGKGVSSDNYARSLERIALLESQVDAAERAQE